MTAVAVDLVKLAMRHVLAITDAVNTHVPDDNKRKGLRQKLRARARELPSLVLGTGLVNALLFYLSKASQDAYKASTLVIPCGGAAQGTPQLADSNEHAYALTARATLCALKTLGYINQDIEDVRSAIVALLALRDREIPAVAELEEYLLSYKRAAEALWEKEE